MAELLITKVTKAELDSAVLPVNAVLVKQYYKSEGAKTKSGLIYGVNTDVNYSDADNPADGESHPADMAEVSNIVVKLPERLYFDEKDQNSMFWETDMELQIGDYVWSNPIDVLNAITLECEGELYKILMYQDLYCAKRIIKGGPFDSFDIIMLNGYVLCEQVYKESLGEP